MQTNLESILFVCLGNICRSPTAHGVMESKLKNAGLENKIKIDSAGTGAYHVGNKPDNRMMKAAEQRGYDLSHLRARAVHQNDYEKYSLILAMDLENYHDLMKDCPIEYQDKIKMFLSFANDSSLVFVPDPYYGGPAGFDEVLDLVEDACNGILNKYI